jgi:hypothetical protein
MTAADVTNFIEVPIFAGWKWEPATNNLIAEAPSSPHL